MVECPLWVKSRHVQRHKRMSALPPKADMCSALADVRFVPIADIHGDEPPSAHGQYGYWGSVPARGRTIFISVNSPRCVSTSIEPPCCFTMMS